MNEPTTKAELLALINTEHDRLTATLHGLTDDQLTQPGVEDEWSIKDLLAHVTWWEQWMIQKLDAAVRGDKIPSLWLPGEDNDAALERLNREIFAASRDRGIGDVREAFDRSFQESLATVAALGEHDIFDPQGLGGILGEAPHNIIAANTYEHYTEHSETIRRWRDTVHNAEN